MRPIQVSPVAEVRPCPDADTGSTGSTGAGAISDTRDEAALTPPTISILRLSLDLLPRKRTRLSHRGRSDGQDREP